MVDVFLGFYCNKLYFAFVWKVCKVVFVLSQWQAGLECGFSVNLKILDENMRDLSLVLQRMVCDHVTVSDVNIYDFKAPKVLMKEVKFAHQQYVQHLEKSKTIYEAKEADEKKKTIHEQISKIKHQKQDVMRCIEVLSCDELNKNRTLCDLAKANVL